MLEEERKREKESKEEEALERGEDRMREEARSSVRRATTTRQKGEGDRLLRFNG